MDAITLTYLLTIPGATAVVLLITQVIKPMLPTAFPTRVLALILSMLIVVGVGLLAAPITVVGIILSVINGFVVTAAAMGSYDVTFKTGDLAKKAGG
jgi:hypothetical protein